MNLLRAAALVSLLVLLLAPAAVAQCPMCRASASQQDARAMESLNLGILILLIPPVAIAAGIMVVAFRYRD